VTTRVTRPVGERDQPPADGAHPPIHGPLRLPDFRKLYAIRLAGQLGDGVFQASLAGAVLFNPEHSARAADIAAGFAVVLLPYSLVGPFAGVLIDRWWRQRILLWTNLARAAFLLVVAAEIAAGWEGPAFYATALVSVSFNRFVLSSLSASLPHTVDPPTIVGANALSTTSGAIAATLGGSVAIGLRSLADPGGGNVSYGVIAIAAAVPYVLASVAATRFPSTALGPDDVERSRRETFAEVLRGLRAGADHIRHRRPAVLALSTIAGHRFCYGISLVSTLLLYRNYFQSDGVLRAGLPGLAQVIALVAVGGALAALVTPAITRHIGLVRYPAWLLVIASITQIAFGLQFTKLAILVAAFVLGFVAQGVKICVDTVIQRVIEDAYRGRVFSLYDTLFNVVFVGAATLTAFALPADGHSIVGVIAVGSGYLLVGAWYGSRRGAGLAVSPGVSPAVSPATSGPPPTA
jgi:MFS family permease